MKLHREPYKLFFLMVMLATFGVVLLVDGFKGYEAHEPSVRFLFGVISICLGPSLMASALNARASEDTGTVWKKTWPATFAGGFIAPLLGVAMLWKLFVK